MTTSGGSPEWLAELEQTPLTEKQYADVKAILQQAISHEQLDLSENTLLSVCVAFSDGDDLSTTLDFSSGFLCLAKNKVPGSWLMTFPYQCLFG